MKEYSFVIPNAKLNTYNWFAFLLVLLNGIFVFYSMRPDLKDPGEVFFSRTSLVFSFFSLAFFLVYRNKILGRYVPHFFVLSMLFLTGFQFFTDRYWLGLLMALLSALYYLSQKKGAIRIRKENISYPSLFQKELEWKELNNVILKDDILTIDLADDRIIQIEIKEAVNEKEFNDFCREQLAAHL